MQTLMFLFIALCAGHQTEFKSDDAVINVDINSNIYVYTITNLSQYPISEVCIPQHSGYNFETPQNWHYVDEKNRFSASTKDSTAAIQTGQSAIFSFRISSKGAVLGKGSVKLVTHQGKELIIPDVYVSVPEPKLYIFLSGGILGGLVILQTIFVIRKQRRQQE